MATALGIASNQGSSSIVIDTSSIQGSGRYGLLGITWNGPSHNGGTAGVPATPAGFTQIGFGQGVGYTPGVAAYWGPLDGVNSVTVTSSPATVHLSGAVVAYDSMSAPSASTRVSGYATSFAGSFPNVAGSGGWMSIVGVNSNTYTATNSLTEDYGYESTQYSGASIFAGSIGSGGFTSQQDTITLSNIDNYGAMFVSFAGAGITYTITEQPDTIQTGTQVGAGVGTDINSTDINGVTVTAGGTMEWDEEFEILPSVPTGTLSTATGANYQVRVTLPSDYDTAQGYRCFFQLISKPGDTALGPQVEATNLTAGALGIIGGETVAVFSADVPIT